MRKYDTVIWDLDGTLLNTLVDLMNSVNYALSELGYPERSLEYIRQSVGNGVRVLMKLSIPGGLDNPHYEEAFELFEKHYAIHSMDNTKAYEGIKDAINILSREGFKQAIVSNKLDSAVKVLNNNFFGVNLAMGDQEGLARKPAPDMVLRAMKILDADKRRTVYIGDSDVDIATARNSGLDSISVLWGFRTEKELEPYNPMKMVTSPQELVKFLLSE